MMTGKDQDREKRLIRNLYFLLLDDRRGTTYAITNGTIFPGYKAHGRGRQHLLYSINDINMSGRYHWPEQAGCGGFSSFFFSFSFSFSFGVSFRSFSSFSISRRG
jgi:hypothetical protein